MTMLHCFEHVVIIGGMLHKSPLLSVCNMLNTKYIKLPKILFLLAKYNINMCSLQGQNVKSMLRRQIYSENSTAAIISGSFVYRCNQPWMYPYTELPLLFSDYTCNCTSICLLVVIFAYTVWESDRKFSIFTKSTQKQANFLIL